MVRNISGEKLLNLVKFQPTTESLALARIVVLSDVLSGLSGCSSQMIERAPISGFVPIRDANRDKANIHSFCFHLVPPIRARK